MIEKKCDRCGKIIEEKKESALGNLANALRNLTASLRGEPVKIDFIITKIEDDLLVDVDLCRSCWNDFDRWMAMKKEKTNMLIVDDMVVKDGSEV